MSMRTVDWFNELKDDSIGGYILELIEYIDPYELVEGTTLYKVWLELHKLKHPEIV